MKMLAEMERGKEFYPSEHYIYIRVHAQKMLISFFVPPPNVPLCERSVDPSN